jgi:hypothetical protein
MAVGFESVGVGDYKGANGATSVTASFKHNSSGGLAVAPMVFSAGNFQFLWYVDSNELTDLTRTVTYGGVPMTSAGVVPWGGDEDAWIELFVLFGAPAGEQTVEGKVFGGVSSSRRLRLSVATYTGVDSVGDPIEGFGTGTAMTIAGTAATNDRFAAVYGTQSGISNFNGDQRYLNNSGISLLIGDAVGTGSSQNVTATRQKSGKWSGMLLPLNAADTVASSAPLAFAPRFDPVKLHREQRTGGLQRNVFTVEAPEV